MPHLCIMRKLRKICQAYRALPNGYYHLCTDGWKEGVLFNNDHQYVAGVTSIALMKLKYNVEIYAYVLMPNHVHIILSGTGSDCTDAFKLLVRRCSLMRKKAGAPPIPKDYGFKLIPIDTPESFRSHILYVARNPYEKGLSVPGGYLWGSDHLLFNPHGERIRGIRADSIAMNEILRIAECPDKLPGHWEIHPEFGILPRNFVKTDKVKALFRTPKNFVTRLVKDYETLLHVSSDLKDEIMLSDMEIDDIFYLQIRKMFPGKTLYNLSIEEKYRLAKHLKEQFPIEPAELAVRLKLSERTVNQALNAKEHW